MNRAVTRDWTNDLVFSACFLMLALLAPGSVSVAAEPTPADVLGEVQRWLDDTRDLQGRFEQRLDSGVFGDAVTEFGRIWVARPGKMRWEYEDPERKLAIVRNGKTWLYLEEDSLVHLGQLDENTRLLPMLLAGDGRLAELFDASFVAPSEGAPKGRFRLRLTPSSGTDAFEEVVVTTTSPGFAVEAVEVLDAVGNRGSYVFLNIRRNRGLSEALFEFQAEEGVETVGGHDL